MALVTVFAGASDAFSCDFRRFAYTFSQLGSGGGWWLGPSRPDDVLGGWCVLTADCSSSGRDMVGNAVFRVISGAPHWGARRVSVLVRNLLCRRSHDDSLLKSSNSPYASSLGGLRLKRWGARVPDQGTAEGAEDLGHEGSIGCWFLRFTVDGGRHLSLQPPDLVDREDGEQAGRRVGTIQHV